MAKVKPIPEGYHSATPYLVVKDGARALEFYKKAFGAKEIMRTPTPDGRIGHAEIQIGDSRIMLADEDPRWGTKSPQSLGGTAASIYLYVDDVDAIFGKAVAAGAQVKEAVSDKFYGDRVGSFVDPFGHYWSVGTHKEDVSQEEMKKRMAAAMGQQPPA